MNALLEHINVMQMLVVVTPKDLTRAPVRLDMQEMALFVVVCSLFEPNL